MKTYIKATATAILLAAGISVAHATQNPTEALPEAYHGRAPQDAAKTLLERAVAQSGPKGSWERIGAGRVYYLGGYKAEGEAIFDAILNGKHADSDVFRIARVYAEANEWAKAKPLFERYLAARPQDEKAYAEIGAYYMLNGDRETAERMFDRALDLENEDPWISEHMAGAYLGVKPEE